MRQESENPDSPQDRHRVVRQVASLLALTTSANAGEAGNALSRVRVLVGRHVVTFQEVQPHLNPVGLRAAQEFWRVTSTGGPGTVIKDGREGGWRRGHTPPSGFTGTFGGADFRVVTPDGLWEEIIRRMGVSPNQVGIRDRGSSWEPLSFPATDPFGRARLDPAQYFLDPAFSDDRPASDPEAWVDFPDGRLWLPSVAAQTLQAMLKQNEEARDYLKTLETEAKGMIDAGRYEDAQAVCYRLILRQQQNPNTDEDFGRLKDEESRRFKNAHKNAQRASHRLGMGR